MEETTDENDPLTEIGTILAFGLIRLNQRKKSRNKAGSEPNKLDFREHVRIHGDEEKSHE